ncbi:hypothetical protein ACQP2X_30465 [Actinoplanes sp. CA-131856]
MWKTIGVTFAAGAVAISFAGCGGAEPQASTWVKPSPPPPARLARITSACDLLPAAAVIGLLGGTEQTTLSGQELPAEKNPNGNVWRHCAYGRDGKRPFALSVATMPNRSGTAEETIDAVAQAGAKPERLDGLGAAAVSYVGDGGRAVMAVVPYGKELRVVQFTGPELVPAEKLAGAVRHVLAEI